MQTIAFLLDHSDILHSEGTGTFSFERNAAISLNPEAFGLKSVHERDDSVLELYYDYEVESGLSAAGADAALARFTEQRQARKLYRLGGWIPREYLLLLLSYHGREGLQERLAQADQSRTEGEVPLGHALVPLTLEVPGAEPRFFVVNRLTRRIFETNESPLEVAI